MKVNIRFFAGQDAFVWDAGTGESLRARCASVTITLLPGRKGKATLVLYKLRDGKPYVEERGDGQEQAAVETIEAEVASIDGAWSSL